MISDGERFACESCIRGHRVSQCQHADRPLQRVQKKGRPVSQCGHCRSLRTSRSVHTKCKCGSTSRTAMLKQFGRDHCRCCEGETCICAHKSPQTAADGHPATISAGKHSRLSATTSQADSGCEAADIAPGPPQSGHVEVAGTAHRTTELDTTHFVLGDTALDNWPFGSLIDTSTAPLDGHLTDFATLDTQNWIEGPLYPPTTMDTNESTHATIPNLDDLLLATHPFSLFDLFSELPQGDQFQIDSAQLARFGDWNSLDFTAPNHHHDEQWFSQP
ncbi:copper fist DNA binding domain-containing protein [Ilyonectria robusta]|uniref:copper fist DNA binding domain-containing protein n=1 Tax=Ilyonectria robusta TaxID=1079257 RepID=UPI001E8ECB92|nr:copper fist DNA binding domain-containing protein [Ilyonectria robusta]KAH8650491.1 copper fist DNA binding domain-containing protein [Ilyonectria robusta]